MNDRMSEQMVGRVAERLRAMADESRIRLLLRLKRGEANVTSLAEELGLAQASASKHLNVLRQAGLVTVRHEGTQSIYAVKDRSIFDMCDMVCGGVLRHLEEERAALGLAADPPNPARSRKVAASR